MDIWPVQENIGAMQITGVGSRRVIQIGAIIAIIFGLIGKFGGLFASMPQAMVSGLFCVMFALIGEESNPTDDKNCLLCNHKDVTWSHMWASPVNPGLESKLQQQRRG